MPKVCMCGMHFACMMAVVNKTLQIRSVPEAVHATLRSRAAAAGMSLSSYLLEELTEMAARPTVAEVLRRAGERSGADLDEIVVAVRADRDRAGGAA